MARGRSRRPSRRTSASIRPEIAAVARPSSVAQQVECREGRAALLNRPSLDRGDERRRGASHAGAPVEKPPDEPTEPDRLALTLQGRREADQPQRGNEEGTDGDDDPECLGAHQRQDCDSGGRADHGTADEQPGPPGLKAAAALDEDPDAQDPSEKEGQEDDLLRIGDEEDGERGEDDGEAEAGESLDVARGEGDGETEADTRQFTTFVGRPSGLSPRLPPPGGSGPSSNASRTSSGQPGSRGSRSRPERRRENRWSARS